MKGSTGDPEFPIWLIGDSPPKTWVHKLDTPLDPRHPARHNIWTSVADPLQDRLFRQSKLRLDTSQLYIRNAFDDPFDTSTQEQKEISQGTLKDLINKHRPSLVLTFGVFAFMQTLYAASENPQKLYKTTALLGEQFRDRINNYDDCKVNILPLLHASIARGRFLEAHRDFLGVEVKICSNYFDYVGHELADLLLARFIDKSVWIT
ncbi:MAG: hypothetical protein WC541_00550 [Dehalococcoidia bacterium]